MSIKTLVQKSRELLVCGLGALHMAGCGGAVFSGDAGAGGAAAGAGSSAGAGVAGSASGGGGSGGAGMCNAACTQLGCGPGFVAVTKPGECCPSCVPDGQGGAAGFGGCAAQLACPAVACADGYKRVQNAGDCCPTCVPDPDACAQDEAGYASLRQQLLQSMSALACATDNDCTRLAVNSRCGEVCFGAPVNATSAPEINSKLSSYAADHCSTCTPIYVSCIMEPPVVCIGSVCIAGGYL